MGSCKMNETGNDKTVVEIVASEPPQGTSNQATKNDQTANKTPVTSEIKGTPVKKIVPQTKPKQKAKEQ